MQMESSEKNIKREVHCDDTDTVKKITHEDENGNTERTTTATYDSEISSSSKANNDISAIEIETIKQQPNINDRKKSFVLSETDHKSSINNDSIADNEEQLNTKTEVHTKSSNSEQVQTSTKFNIEHNSDKEQRADEEANSEDDNENTESVDDRDGLCKAFKAIISRSSGKFRTKDEENESFGFEDKRMTYNPRGNKTQTVIDPDYYNFNNPQRGHMMLIVNDTFTKQSFRHGSHFDLSNMKEIARKFGFRLFNDEKYNLTKPETMRLLRETQSADHSNCDCFLFMISTHGLEQRNSRAKDKLDHALVCADDQLIFTSSILEMFNDENCPALKNKPKIFFIQACRGEDVDHGSDVYVVENTTVDKPSGVPEVSSEERLNPATQLRLWKESSIDEYDVKFKYDTSETHKETKCMTFPQSLHRPEAHFHLPCQSHTVIHAQGLVSAKSGAPANPLMYKQTGEIPMQNPWKPRLTPSCCTPKVTQTHLQPVPPPHSTTQQPYHPYSRFMPFSSQLSSSMQMNKIYTPTTYAIPVVNTPSLRCDNDMLVMYAIPQGMIAWRSTGDGSWMIHYLHQVLMEYDMRRPKSLLTLLTKVSSRMAERSTETPSEPSLHKKKAIPVIEHKLIKDVIFTPKLN